MSWDAVERGFAELAKRHEPSGFDAERRAKDERTNSVRVQRSRARRVP
jgi:hypothetical protein